MSWCYRASKEKLDDGTYWYSVREFYHDTPMGKGWTREAITPGSETKKGLIEDLEQMVADIRAGRVFTIPHEHQHFFLDNQCSCGAVLTYVDETLPSVGGSDE